MSQETLMQLFIEQVRMSQANSDRRWKSKRIKYLLDTDKEPYCYKTVAAVYLRESSTNSITVDSSVTSTVTWKAT